MKNVWSVVDSDGNTIADGFQGPEICDAARQAAQRIANDRETSVWLVGPDGQETEVAPKSARTIKTAHLTSVDPTITVPDEVRLDEQGHAWAIHDGQPDVFYASLPELEVAYQIDVPRADLRPDILRILGH